MKQTGSSEGLNSSEALKRLKKYGLNAHTDVDGSILKLVLEQFINFFTLVLIFISVFLYVSGEIDAFQTVIFLILFNGILGILQKNNLIRALFEIARKTSASVTVVRDGLYSDISVRELVPGDIIILSEGMEVPADIQLLDGTRLEFEDTSKFSNDSADLIRKANQSKLEENLIYAGTLIKKGSGKGLVVVTGSNSCFAQTAAIRQNIFEQTHPLRKRLGSFRKKYLMVSMSLTSLIILLNRWQGVHSSSIVMLVILVILTYLPAIPLLFDNKAGAQWILKRLLKQSRHLRLLAGMEKLGSISRVVLERKGLLSKNKISIEEIYVGGKTIIRPGSRSKEIYEGDLLSNPFFMLMIASAIANDAFRDDNGAVVGDPRDVTLYNFARNSGFYKEALVETFPGVAEYSFNNGRCLTTFHKAPFKDRGCEYISFSIGDFDLLYEKSECCLSANGLKKNNIVEFAKANQKMAKMGQEVIAVTMRCWANMPLNIVPGMVESNLTLIGLVGMMDPVSEGTKDVVQFCHNMGVNLTLTTNEHVDTARAIARKMGLTDDPKALLNGKDMDNMTEQELNSRSEYIKIYTRLNFEQKKRVITALQNRREIVAIVADKACDQPLLQHADVSFLAGGSQNRNGAAHLQNLVEGIREARIAYNNLNKSAQYMLTLSISELLMILLAKLFGFPLMLPIHLLWINIVIGAGLAFALSLIPDGKKMRNEVSRPIKNYTFDNGFNSQVIYSGLLIGAITLLVQVLTVDGSDESWSTLFFVSFGLMQISYAGALVDKCNISSRFSLSNMNRLGIIFLLFILQSSIPYISFLRSLLSVNAVPVSDWVYCFISPLALFAILKIKKIVSLFTKAVVPC